MSIGSVGGQATPQGAQRPDRDGGTANLLQGQIVSGKVMQLGANGAIVELGGQLLQLPAAASMVVGQQIALLVKEAGQNPVLIPVADRETLGAAGGDPGEARLEQLLRALGLPVEAAYKDALRQLLATGRPIAGEILRKLAQEAATASRPDARQESTDAALARLLDSLDLPSDEPHLNTAKGLMAQGLRLTRENIDGLTRTLARLQSTGEANFQAAAYLKANGLPLTDASLRLARALLADPQPLGGQLHTVRTALATLADALEASLPPGSGLDRAALEGLVEESAQQLSQRILTSEGGDRSRLVESLQRLVKDQGTSLEGRLALVLSGKTDPSELEQDLRTLLGRLVDMAHAVGSRSPGEAELRRAAMLLRETASEMADGLQAQQLRNAASPALRTGGEQWINFQLPFAARPDGYPRTAELRVSRGPDRELDASRLRLVLRLELEQLRTVEVRVQIVGNQMTCALASDSAATVPILEADFDGLRHALEGLGYVVSSGGVGMLAADDSASASRRLPDHLARVDCQA